MNTWLAQYYHYATYDGDYQIWQMTDSGRVLGINEPVDIDIMYLKPGNPADTQPPVSLKSLTKTRKDLYVFTSSPAHFAHTAIVFSMLMKVATQALLSQVSRQRS